MGVLGAVLLLTLALVLAWLILIAIVWLHRPTRAFAGPALRMIPDLVLLVRSLLADPGTPMGARLALGGLLAYLLSPIDLIPDFIPVLGSIDDVVLSAVVLRWTAHRIGVERLRAHWSGPQSGFELLTRLLGLER